KAMVARSPFVPHVLTNPTQTTAVPPRDVTRRLCPLPDLHPRLSPAPACPRGRRKTRNPPAARLPQGRPRPRGTGRPRLLAPPLRPLLLLRRWPRSPSGSRLRGVVRHPRRPARQGARCRQPPPALAPRGARARRHPYSPILTTAPPTSPPPKSIIPL